MCPSASSLPIVRGRDWLREGSSCLCSGRSGGGSGSSERFVRRVITADCEMDEIVCMSRLEVCGEADGSSERALSAASSSTLRWARLSVEVGRLEERLDLVSSDLADIEQGEGEGVPAGLQASKARVSDVSVGVITADCEVGEIVCVSRLEVCGEADGSSERN